MGGGVPMSFDEFWSIYPRRVARKAAQKSFDKAVKDDSEDAVMDGTRKQVAYWEKARTEEKFIPHATTYLNQGRYLDPPTVEENAECQLDPHTVMRWHEKYRRDPRLVPQDMRRLLNLGEYAKT